MTHPLPPPLATWMLRRLATGLHSEALEGDLLEAWHSGRSDAWYWGQALGALRVRTRKALLTAVDSEMPSVGSIADLALWIAFGIVGCFQLCVYASFFFCWTSLSNSDLGIFIEGSLLGGTLIGAVAIAHAIRTTRPRQPCFPHSMPSLFVT